MNHEKYNEWKNYVLGDGYQELTNIRETGLDRLSNPDLTYWKMFFEIETNTLFEFCARLFEESAREIQGLPVSRKAQIMDLLFSRDTEIWFIWRVEEATNGSFEGCLQSIPILYQSVLDPTLADETVNADERESFEALSMLVKSLWDASHLDTGAFCSEALRSKSLRVLSRILVQSISPQCQWSALIALRYASWGSNTDVFHLIDDLLKYSSMPDWVCSELSRIRALC